MQNRWLSLIEHGALEERQKGNIARVRKTRTSLFTLTPLMRQAGIFLCQGYLLRWVIFFHSRGLTHVFNNFRAKAVFEDRFTPLA